MEENSPVPIRIFGFCERPPEQSVKAKDPMPGSLPQPDKFSEYWQTKLEEELRSRKYSKCTQRIYLFFNHLLCNTLNKIPENINPEDFRQFLAFIEKEKKYSASSMNLAISAIRFFYKTVLKNNIVSEQRRPRHDKKLPMVLSKTEINRILNLETNMNIVFC